MTLRANPFNLEYLDFIFVEIIAHNSRGWSDNYLINDALIAPQIQTEPLIMPKPTEGSATSRSVVEILWLPIASPNDGGSSILSYNVYWDQGINQWKNLVGQTSDYLGFHFSVGGRILESNSYNFKIRGVNRWGFGPFSDITTIIASGSPYKV